MSDEAKADLPLKRRFYDSIDDVFVIVVRAIRGMAQNNVTIMASGLVYSTLVAIIPCITFFVAFLSVFGLLQPFMNALGGLFEDLFGSRIGDQLMDLISQYTSNAMGLGVFGLVSFMITATFLVDKVYNVLNQIFRTQPRAGKFRRFTSFLTFLIIGVVLLAVVIALNSSIMGFLQVKLTGDGIETSFFSEAVKTIMGLFVTLGVLFLLYYFVPNTKVRSRSALLGAALGSSCLCLVFTVFKMIVGRMVTYSVIYGSLASLFFVLLFLYVCWYIILTCAEVIYVHQFKPAGSQLAGQAETPSRQVADAVDTMMLVASAYRAGQGAMSQRELTKRLAVTPAVLQGHLALLVKKGLLIEVPQGRNIAYIPSRPLDQILLCDIFDAVYGWDDDNPADTAGEAVAEQVRSSSSSTLSSLTLENLLERV